MNCIETEKEFDALIDGELDPRLSREVEAHLEACVDCRTDFENLALISRTVKRTPAVAAPAGLDERVFRAFDAIHREKRPEPAETIRPAAKSFWFGIPRLVFASALVLFALSIISAFQLGRMSVGGKADPADKNTAQSEKKATPPAERIVEVPVIREKIVEVPVVREKVITRTVFLEKRAEKEEPKKTDNRPSVQKDLALKSSVAENGYLTQTDLSGFRPVSDVKTNIIKRNEENEK
ncbi:MAG: zf-HC2 domain-containing protein [Pyrinomonadaceae bacterium]